MTQNPTTEDLKVEPGRELIVPGTGELVNLDSDTEVLAQAVVEINERIAEIKQGVLTPVDAELLARLDRKRSWTLRVGDVADGVQFELKAPGLDAGTEAYDPRLLDDELAGLVKRKTIDQDAAAAAIKRTITVVIEIPFGNDLEPLADRLKSVNKIADVDVTVLSASPGRTPNLRGIGALRKGDGCGAALDRAQLPKQTPKRSVKVTKIEKAKVG